MTTPVNMTRRAPPKPNRASQPCGVRGVSTMPLIFSVIERNVRPRATYGDGSGSDGAGCGATGTGISGARVDMLPFLDEFRVGVVQGGEVRGPRHRVQIAQQRVIQ